MRLVVRRTTSTVTGSQPVAGAVQRSLSRSITRDVLPSRRGLPFRTRILTIVSDQSLMHARALVIEIP
jgi:hypothetical protein